LSGPGPSVEDLLLAAPGTLLQVVPERACRPGDAKLCGTRVMTRELGTRGFGGRMCVFRVRDIERMDDGMEGNGWGERPKGGGINHLGVLWLWGIVRIAQLGR